MHTIACPCCRAGNAAGPNCRRCSADLSLLFKMEEDRELLLANAGHHIVTDNIPEALQLISRAELLRSGKDIQRLRAVASLLNLDYRTAVYHHRHATVSELRAC